MKNLYSLATISLFFLFSLLSAGSISIFFGSDISVVEFYFSLAFTFLFTLIFFEKRIYNFLIAISLFLCCIVVSQNFIDLSFDGQGYHLASVLALEKSWNPFFENLHTRTDIYLENVDFVQFYPHTEAILTLEIYKLTKDVEAGKAIVLFVVLVSALFIFCAIFEVTQSRFLTTMFTFLAIINPVSLVQIFTFGGDSLTYSFLIILLSTGILIYKRHWVLMNYCIFTVSSIYFINCKLVNIVYYAIFICAFLLYLFFDKNFSRKNLLELFLVTIVSGIMSLFLFGYHPFVTNYLYYKNPFYPVFHYDYNTNRPSNYLQDDRVSLFFKSLFWEVNGEFLPPKDVAEYKLPFIYSEQERLAFDYLGPKVGGFGVYFGGIVILLFILFCLILYEGGVNKVLIISVVVVLFTCILNPLNNVARYIPQLWFLIPLIMFFSWRLKGIKIFLLNFFIFSFTVMNCCIVFQNNYEFSLESSRALKTYLVTLGEVNKDKNILVNFGQSEGNQFLLDKYGINYTASRVPSAEFVCIAERKLGLKKVSLLGNIGNSVATTCIK